MQAFTLTNDSEKPLVVVTEGDETVSDDTRYYEVALRPKESLVIFTQCLKSISVA